MKQEIVIALTPFPLSLKFEADGELTESERKEVAANIEHLQELFKKFLTDNTSKVVAPKFNQ